MRARGPIGRGSSTARTVVLLVTAFACLTASGTGATARRADPAPAPASVTTLPAALPAALPATLPAALPTAPPARPGEAWVGAAPMAASAPVRLQIPAIEVDSTLVELGLAADGTMAVPPGGFPAGWYTGAPTPGELGPAIIAGHVDWEGPGVFYELHTLAPGDEVIVTRADGSIAVFRVTSVEQYPKSEFPTDAVYGDIDHAGLRLITCGGEFNREAGHHEDNVVVFAELV